MFSSDDGGDPTEIVGTIATALPKKLTGRADLIDAGDLIPIEFGALAGARFTLQGKATDDMRMRVIYVVRPDGDLLPFEAVTETEKGSKFTVSFECPQDGTYVLYLTPRPGPLGDLAYKLSIKQPKGGEYTPPSDD